MREKGGEREVVGSHVGGPYLGLPFFFLIEVISPFFPSFFRGKPLFTPMFKLVFTKKVC